jgi:hypothetical protein
MKRALTAKEQQDILDQDPQYQAMMAQKRRGWAEKAALLHKDEEPLVAALTSAGWPEAVRQCGETRSVWDLVNTAEPYPHLLDTLVDHLARPYHRRTREGIARSLAVREAKGTRIPRSMMAELKKETDPSDSYRWAIINTLISMGDSSIADDVKELLTDARYESVRPHLSRLAKKVTSSRQ